MDPEGTPVVFTAQSKRFFYCREAVCEFALSRGVVPIHPFMAFGYFLSDRGDRNAVRRANDTLVSRCDELWVFGEELSNGVLHEIALASATDKVVRFFSISDLPERIEELHVDALRFEEEVRTKTGQGRERLLEDLRRVLPSATTGRSLALDL